MARAPKAPPPPPPSGLDRVKQPSHDKLLANSCWQAQIGVCERHSNILADCWRQIELVSILTKFFPTSVDDVVVVGGGGGVVVVVVVVVFAVVVAVVLVSFTHTAIQC